MTASPHESQSQYNPDQWISSQVEGIGIQAPFFEKIIKGSPNGVIVLGPKGPLYSNGRTEKILGSINRPEQMNILSCLEQVYEGIQKGQEEINVGYSWGEKYLSLAAFKIDEGTVGVIVNDKTEEYALTEELRANLTQRDALIAELQALNEAKEDTIDQTIFLLSHTLEMRDRETAGHTNRVARMTLDMAREMGIPEEQLTDIHRGALLHDIGKLGIPDSILLKPGELTDEEKVEIQKHPEFAWKFLGEVKFLRFALDIPYCHHERWDGKGYPNHRLETQIPLSARIFAVIDVYDALTSERPYKKPWSREKALREIRNQSGTQFDPAVVKAFMKYMSENE